MVLGFLAGRPVTQGTLPPPTATIRVKPAKGVDLVRRNAKEKVMKTKKFAQAGQSSGVSKLP